MLEEEQNMSSSDDPESLMIDEETSTLGLQNINDISWIALKPHQNLGLENFTKPEMKGIKSTL